MEADKMGCKFDKSWIGPCGKECIDGSEYCKEHNDKICSGCGEKATRDCGETLQLVCGFPLCDNCEHKYRDDSLAILHGPKGDK